MGAHVLQTLDVIEWAEVFYMGFLGLEGHLGNGKYYYQGESKQHFVLVFSLLVLLRKLAVRLPPAGRA